MKIDILTLFPEFFSNLLNWSIIGKAVDKNILNIEFINIRDFSINKHKKVDDYPYGGGPGMVMTPQPLSDCIKSVQKENSYIIYLSPRGKVFTQDVAINLSKKEHIVLICGHYEGIDQRIIDKYVDEEISIGDYILTGGELGALVLVDSISRLLPGVLGNEESSVDESFSNNLLEYHQYTRPSIFEGLEVPEVLLSGNHKEIEEYRKQEAIDITMSVRPDMLKKE